MAKNTGLDWICETPPYTRAERAERTRRHSELLALAVRNGRFKMGEGPDAPHMVHSGAIHWPTGYVITAADRKWLDGRYKPVEPATIEPSEHEQYVAEFNALEENAAA